jgi:hypothetical protein
MAWVAVWCCCPAPAEAAEPDAHACCEATQTKDDGSTHHSREDCPFVRLRMLSVVPTPPPLPDFDDAPPLPAILTASLPALSVADVFLPAFPVSERPPPGSLTLLALHTSLLW